MELQDLAKIFAKGVEDAEDVDWVFILTQLTSKIDELQQLLLSTQQKLRTAEDNAALFSQKLEAEQIGTRQLAEALSEILSRLNQSPQQGGTRNDISSYITDVLRWWDDQ